MRRHLGARESHSDGQNVITRHHESMAGHTTLKVGGPAETFVVAETEQELIDHAREWIAGYKVPKSVEFRAEPLPLSGAMKVLKRELRDPYWAGHERRVN